MSPIEWKVAYALELERLTGLKWIECCDASSAMLTDCLDGDTEDLSPADAVNEELLCWHDGL